MPLYHWYCGKGAPSLIFAAEDSICFMIEERTYMALFVGGRVLEDDGFVCGGRGRSWDELI